MYFLFLKRIVILDFENFPQKIHYVWKLWRAINRESKYLNILFIPSIQKIILSLLNDSQKIILFLLNESQKIILSLLNDSQKIILSLLNDSQKIILSLLNDSQKIILSLLNDSQKANKWCSFKQLLLKS